MLADCISLVGSLHIMIGSHRVLSTDVPHDVFESQRGGATDIHLPHWDSLYPDPRQHLLLDYILPTSELVEAIV